MFSESNDDISQASLQPAEHSITEQGAVWEVGVFPFIKPVTWEVPQRTESEADQPMRTKALF